MHAAAAFIAHELTQGMVPPMVGKSSYLYGIKITPSSMPTISQIILEIVKLTN